MKKILLAVTLATALTSQAQTLPYQNPSLPVEQRVDDLLGRLTLEEKVSLMMNGSPAIPRLNIPQFDWWSEALHGVGRNGVSTVFPSCIGMACSFDEELVERIYTAVSDEARAKNTAQRRQGKPVGKYQGLSFWTPNINIFRDPRWGRGQETYGEDVLLNAQMGLRVVRGLQGEPGSRYFKLHACAKHFAVHSGPEKTRHNFNIEGLPHRDLWETYLPAFRRLVQEGNVQQVMCAYQRFEGSPCCGSNRLLQQILRDEWGFQGLVVSDCGAVSDFWQPNRHGVSSDAANASAHAVLSGTDVECGSNYRNLPAAVQRGDISEEQLNVSLRRLLRGRFELGNFDADSLVEWTNIPLSVVASPEHKQLALQMGREQMVLLQNRDNLLPLSRQDASRIMVMGPNAADSTMLWGIYFGQPSHTVTPLEGIRAKAGSDIPYVKGCEITALTESQSLFNLIRGDDGRQGMHATYWNNTQMQGRPAAQAHYTTPIQLDNGGATVFAPGVELTNFTTRMKGWFIAERTETLNINFTNDDGMRIIVNGDTLHNRWRADWAISRNIKLNVEQGKRYDVEINYMQLADDASLCFDIARNKQVSTDDIVRRAAQADIIIFVGGISPNLEREQARVDAPGFDGGDRTSIELPEAQRQLLRALHDAGKKIVLVNCSGSCVALTPETETCDAILQAWYAGEQGGHALADVLFGDYNPSGKLSVTFYRDDSQLPAFDDYRMNGPIGRTYRYFRGQPLYPFGYGLSYTSFNISQPLFANNRMTCTVRNTGNREGTEIVQVYMRRADDADGPLKTLCGYQRISLQPGQAGQVTIQIPRERFETWDPQTNTMRVIPGTYELMVGSSSADSDLLKFNIQIQ